MVKSSNKNIRPPDLLAPPIRREPPKPLLSPEVSTALQDLGLSVEELAELRSQPFNVATDSGLPLVPPRFPNEWLDAPSTTDRDEPKLKPKATPGKPLRKPR